MTLYLRWNDQVRPLQINRVDSFSMFNGELHVWVDGAEYIYRQPDSLAGGE